MQETPKSPVTIKLSSFMMVVIILVVCIALAGWVGWSMGHRAGFQKGETETRAKYEERLEAFLPPLPTEQTTFSGTVEKIENKILFVRGPKPTADVLEMGQEATLKVKVTDATKIFKITPLPPEEIPAPREGEEFIPPEPFKRTEMKFEEIKPGMSIFATAAENIIGKTEFEAVEIQITELGPELPPAPEVPPMPPAPEAPPTPPAPGPESPAT